MVKVTLTARTRGFFYAPSFHESYRNVTALEIGFVYWTKKQRSAMIEEISSSFIETIKLRKEEVRKQFTTKDALTNFVISAVTVSLWQTRNLSYETAAKIVLQDDAYEPIVEACWAELQHSPAVAVYQKT